MVVQPIGCPPAPSPRTLLPSFYAFSYFVLFSFLLSKFKRLFMYLWFILDYFSGC